MPATTSSNRSTSVSSSSVVRANGESSSGQSWTIVGSISSGSTKCENAWSTSCDQVVSSARVDARARPASRAARPRRATRRSCPRAPRRSDTRCQGVGRSTSCPRKVDPGRAQGLRAAAADELLGPGHRVPVVGVRLVPLELRELGRVLVGDALVAEVLGELVDLLEPADDQPLEVELVRDPQVEVGVELVRVRDERLGEARRRSAAGGSASRPRGSPPRPGSARTAATIRCARPRVRARLLVHQQVEVALPVPGLDVGDAVEGVRQRPLDLARAARARRRRGSARRGGSSPACR